MMHLEPSITIMISEIENGYVITHKVKKGTHGKNTGECVPPDTGYDETSYIAESFSDAMLLLKDLLGETKDKKGDKPKEAISNESYEKG